MRPQKLKIKGLNSFIDEQSIDFSKLTEKGLFGIFGPTGSGKSTILDAITLALYGKIARDTKEFINSECEDLSITYEFAVGKGPNEVTYAVERNLKKEQQSYRTTLARICEIRDGELYAVLTEGARPVEKSIERIIGLTCDDFTRSVVLPQGKFSEFLKLTGTERRNMLERIFRLETYGKKLRDRIRKIKKEKLDEALVIETKLGHYSEISEELVQQKKKQLKELQLQEATLKKELEAINQQYEKYKTLWEFQKELLQNEEKHRNLMGQQEQMNQRKDQLLKAKGADIIKPYIEDLHKTQKKQMDIEYVLKDLEEKLEKLSKELIAIEEQYEKATDQKNTLYPKLLQREANLQQAIQLDQQVKEVEKEREELVKDYQECQQRIKEDTERLKQVMNQGKQNEERLSSIIDKINELKVDPTEREQIGEALQIEKKYIEEIKLREETEKKYQPLQKEVEIANKEHQQLVDQEKQHQQLFQQWEKKRKDLEDHFPGDQELLFERRQQLDQLTTQVTQLEELTKQKLELLGKKEVVKQEILEIDTKMNHLRKQLEHDKQLLKQLKDEIKKIEVQNLASILGEKVIEGESCPVCGSIHHPNVATGIDEGLLKDKQRSENELEKKVEEEQILLGKFEVQWAQNKKEEEYLKEQEDQIHEKMKDLNLEELQTQKTSKNKEYEHLKEKIEQWEKEKKIVEEGIGKEKEEIHQYHTKLAALEEGLKKDRQILKELQHLLEEKQDFIHQLSTEYKEYKEFFQVRTIEERAQQIKKFDVDLVKYQKKENSIREEIKKAGTEKEKIIEQLNELKDQKGRIEERGQEKRKTIDRLKNEIQKATKEMNPSVELMQVQKQIKELLEQEESIRKKRELLIQEKQGIQEKKISEERMKETLSELYIEQEEKLNNQLSEKKFADTKEVLDSFRTKEEQQKLENQINTYEDHWKEVENNIKRLKELLNGEEIREEQWREFNDQRQEKIDLAEGISKEIAVMEKVLKDMEEQLSQLKNLLKEKKKIDHTCSLLDDLDKLIQGNKFVEFVAMHQLDYIAKEASKTLKNITRGRYALELDSNGNFIMRDDFNGGTRRDTNTLSGGETFLTSLALALALSSQIQLKNKAPLEFFFLDEGFGTLDQELLDIVMGALERLHTERLAVGIISHVEELKNRIPVKLMVSPAEPGMGGSKVKIEYS